MKDKSRYRDLATLLPWLAFFLFTPPVLFLFRPEVTIGGVPLLPIYLFGIWFVLIIASQQLARHLVEEPKFLDGTTQDASLGDSSTKNEDRP